MSRLNDLSWRLSMMASETLPCHWIATPDGDEGREWCPDCGWAKVRNLRRRDRRRRSHYILDGGWRTNHDSMPICAGCGAFLDGYLTSFGASQELDYYCEAGLSTSAAVDALYLSEILDSIDQDDDEAVAAAVALAREVLALRHPAAIETEGAGRG